LSYDLHVPDDGTVAAFIEEARAERADIPEYAYDVHTPKGKRAGKTKRDFFSEEHAALSPRVQGTFDDDLEAFRRGERGELPKR
jgi:hypothetical protein